MLSTVASCPKKVSDKTLTLSPTLNFASTFTATPLFLRIGIISCIGTGTGFARPPLDPKKPVTIGVLRTTNQDSSVTIISTKIYPG